MATITSTPTTINDMQKTQLTSAIEKLDELLKELMDEAKEADIDSQEFSGIAAERFQLQMYRTFLIDLLPQEKEDMEKAYAAGFIDDVDSYRATYFTDNYSQYKP